LIKVVNVPLPNSLLKEDLYYGFKHFDREEKFGREFEFEK